ncbi:MAG: hypothetical protein ACR2P6_01150 [Gammaproteobacteria bacterium]
MRVIRITTLTAAVLLAALAAVYAQDEDAVSGASAFRPEEATQAVADPEPLRLGQSEIHITWRGTYTRAQKNKLRDWQQAVAETMSLLHGELPRPAMRITLHKTPAAEPVPFARVIRQNPQGVYFYVNPEYPVEDFVNDWTAYHEFSHLFIPWPGRDDIWFSEGLASYYQNILQWRAGLLSEQEAWQKLYEGFERARADNENSNLTLAELSPVMGDKRAFMRVYWTGALYFVEADTALRAASDNRQSLDTILRSFGECCLTDKRRWKGMDIAREFDRISNTDIFVPLYRRYASTNAIPDYALVLAPAGVRIENGRVILESTPER